MVPSLQFSLIVIPAKAGIQIIFSASLPLDLRPEFILGPAKGRTRGPG
jgi:hypothetical protein